MNATRPILSKTRHCLLACGLLATVALSACAPAGGRLAASGDPDDCGPAAECEEPGRLASQVRLDADAILAGMAHARARLGLQEDAAP